MDWQLVASYFNVKSTNIFLQCMPRLVGLRKYVENNNILCYFNFFPYVVVVTVFTTFLLKNFH